MRTLLFDGRVWDCMRVTEVEEKKKQYLPLLLLADEQEDMIDRYLERGTMYVLEDDGLCCECVVTDEGDGVLEIKNIATLPERQRKGYAGRLIEFLADKYTGQYRLLHILCGLQLLNQLLPPVFKRGYCVHLPLSVPARRIPRGFLLILL